MTKHPNGEDEKPMIRIYRSTGTILLKALILALLFGCPLQPNVVVGQDLSEEMRETFEQMLPQLDVDLQAKVRDAIDKNRDYLELTSDEFRRFRDHPANPFEGWDGIDPSAVDGLIRLRFETQPIRSRVPNRYERQSDSFLRGARDLVKRANAGTVVVSSSDKQIALGTVISADGHIVTKLSELGEDSDLSCRGFDGRNWSAKVVAKNQANDIAILKIPANQLPPVKFAAHQPEVGSFIFSTNGQANPMAFGVYSNPPRSLIGENQAFLGVKPVSHVQGVQVVEVTRGSSADAIGMQVGDVLLSINGNALDSVQSLVNEIRKNQPGDKITIQFIRGGKTQSATALLAGRNVGGPTADRFAQMKTFGAIQSKRRSEFPLVFQHDTPLVPEQCGGPVTNLDGQVVGINIARGGRVASYAIPAQHVRQLAQELLRPNVASKKLD